MIWSLGLRNARGVLGLALGRDEKVAAAGEDEGGHTNLTEPVRDAPVAHHLPALEDPAEGEMVRRLLQLRDAITGRTEHDASRAESIAGVREDALRAVNDYFERVLSAVPTIRSYLDSVAATHMPPR